MKKITRKEARENGSKVYFTGKLCKHNHLSERRVDNLNCIECLKQTNKHQYKTKKNERNKKRLNKKYGITTEMYNQLLNEHNYCCAICRIPEKDLKKKLAVDHNHETGEVRGLLCDKCNRGIGMLGDSERICNKAAGYLSNYKKHK